MNTTSPTDCNAWTELGEQAESWKSAHLRDLLADAARNAQCVVTAAGGRYDYSRQRLGAVPLRLLAHLAEQRGFAEWRDALLSGKVVNSTENRAAWHTALRASSPPPEVRDTLERMRGLARKIREEKRIRRIVNLGTGGSD